MPHRVSRRLWWPNRVPGTRRLDEKHGGVPCHVRVEQFVPRGLTVRVWSVVFFVRIHRSTIARRNVTSVFDAARDRLQRMH
jgi:hypothetical protein